MECMSYDRPDTAESNVVRPAKLFIGGLTRNTTTKQLRDHFSAYGRVLDCVAMRQPDGRPRGFGYVTLDSEAAAERVVSEPQVIDGRIVDMKRAVPEGSGGQKHSHLSAAYESQFWPHDAQAHLSPYAFGHAAWPWNEAAAAAAAVAAAAAAARAAVPKVAGYASSPDCVELLSRNRPAQLTGAIYQDSGSFSWPETPSAGGLLSPLAPEFVPSFAGEDFSPPKCSRRAVLGEITNVTPNCMPKKVSKTNLGSQKSILGSENILDGPNKPTVLPAGRVIKALDADTENVDPNVKIDSAGEVENPDLSDDDSDDNEFDANFAEVSFDGPLPSIGSAEHVAGKCKRCNFFPKGRCQNGQSCIFCHYPHDRRKLSRQEKRERRANWSGQPDVAYDDLSETSDCEVPQAFSFSMLPGMPATCTTKLPAPLLLPGSSFEASGLSTCPPRIFPSPPPGLMPLTGLEAWQPDAEVSPVRSSMAPVLATVPMSGYSHPTGMSPTSAAHVQASVAKSSMVTIGTQTADEENEAVTDEAVQIEEKAASSVPCYSRHELLSLRAVTVDGLRTEASSLKTCATSLELCN